jgi:hypothetical protein
MPNIVPGVYGKAEITFNPEADHYRLFYNGIPWMVTDKNHHFTKNSIYSQYDLAHGDVLLTGLGFGLLAVAISQKENVSSVTVLELNSDVIDAFLKSNQLNNKITIISGDARTYTTDLKYDCLLPDHYEHQPPSWILQDMANIFKRINTETYWPWGVEGLFLKTVYSKNKKIIQRKGLVKEDKEDVLGKWKKFIIKNSLEHPTLLNISSTTLIKYLNKWIKNY